LLIKPREQDDGVRFGQPLPDFFLSVEGCAEEEEEEEQEEEF